MWLMKCAFTLYRNPVSYFPLYKLIINDSQSQILTAVSHKHNFIMNSEEVTPICRRTRISESVHTQSHTCRWTFELGLFNIVSERDAVWCSTCPANTIKMGEDYFGFSYLRNENRRNVTIHINNPADISVIVIYFLVVLAVGVWVSGQQFTSTNILHWLVDLASTYKSTRAWTMWHKPEERMMILADFAKNL